MVYVYARFFLNIKIPERFNTSPAVLVSIQKMLHALHVMLSAIMAPTSDENSVTVENYIKIFLSSCNQFSKDYYGANVEPFWHKTGNFPTLLCLPEQIKKYGSVRWYWEGTSERYIQQVKRFLTAFRRSTSYFKNKMTLMYKTYICEWIEEILMSDEKKESVSNKKSKSYYQYKDSNKLIEKLSTETIISAFTVERNNRQRLLVAHGHDRRTGLMNIVEMVIKDDVDSRNVLGLPYFRIEADWDGQKRMHA